MTARETTASYRCHACGAEGVRLWRPYQTTAPDLLCAACAHQHEGKPDPGGDGMPTGTDQIGWHVPAIPLPADYPFEGFHGYGAVPEDAQAWWWALPTRAAPKESASLFEG